MTGANIVDGAAADKVDADINEAVEAAGPDRDGDARDDEVVAATVNKFLRWDKTIGGGGDCERMKADVVPGAGMNERAAAAPGLLGGTETATVVSAAAAPETDVCGALGFAVAF